MWLTVGKWQKVVKSAKKWRKMRKVGKSKEKWLKVCKKVKNSKKLESGEKW